MVSLPFSSNAAPAAVRRPTFAIQFGSGDGSGGGLGGLAGAAASVLGVGGGGEDPWQRSVVAIHVQLGIAPFVDDVTLILAADSQAPAVALEDVGSISLGYGDSEAIAVFKGQLSQIRRSLQGTKTLRVANGGAALTQLRVNKSFEQQTAGKIVKELANQVEVETDTIEDGLDLPVYAVSDRAPAYQHIATLAQKSGYLAYFTPAGKLCFVPPASAEAVQTFVYAQDILALDLTETTASKTITVIGDGAAGSQGTDAWSWLVNDPGGVTATAGTGTAAAIASDGAIRSQQAATQAATAIAQQAASLNLSGRVWVAGAAAIAVGSTFKITDAPDDALNGSFLAYQVWHHYAKATGFTTLINCRKASADGGLGGLLGGLL